MYLITVIPISRGIGKDTLTYFTRENPPVGCVVGIPLRGKQAKGIVIDSKPAAESKSEIKTLVYSIRKIDKIESHNFLSDTFILAARDIADYTASTTGAVLSALIPKVILESNDEISFETSALPPDGFHESLVLQADTEERFATYKSLIREELAKNKSVFLCFPTIEDMRSNKSLLEKGIETYTHMLHGGLNKKQLIETWKKALAEPHPILILATGQFLSLPRRDIGTIIIEKESSRSYQMQVRPWIDIRKAGTYVAKAMHSKILFGDSLLRIETLWHHKEGRHTEISPLKFRSLSTASSELVNMRTSKDFASEKFSMFSPELLRIIEHTKENNEHTFLFCGRKGLFPSTVCSDCGTIVSCDVCKSVVVLYEHKNGNMYVCHHCSARRPADTKCIHCGGWRLTTLGIGIDQAAKEIADMFPETPLIVMDKDRIKNQSNALKARDTFYSSPGAVLLGTEFALPYLSEKIEHAGVISMDSLFSIPDFRIHEKIFHILLDMRAVAEKSFIIQTRQKDTALFDLALKGNLIDFYRNEIEERKQMNFPPFISHIKLSIQGDKKSIEEKMNELSRLLAPHELAVFPSWSAGRVPQLNGLITLPHGAWVDADVLAKLRSLPQSVAVKVDPETIL